MTPDSWRRAYSALRTRDHKTAHIALAAHFAERPTAFPLNARDLAALARTIASEFPGARDDAVRRADALLEGRYNLLGYSDVVFGREPDWHADPVHDRRARQVFWADVRYLDPASGDHKIIWELNRHQHWLALGRAHALSGDRRYYVEFTRQLSAWLAANPPLIGTNWASMLELAFRVLSWLWALEMFATAASAEDSDPWTVDLLLAVDRQLTHIEHNLSHYFSPNTHLSGEALALYIAGVILPEFRASPRRAQVGRDILVREASRQIRADGGHAELSPHYHRYSTDFYLLAALVARRAGDAAAPVFEEAAAAQARYLRTVTNDRGLRPSIGDDDGGQMFPICGRSAADCADTLATASIMFDDPTLSIGTVPEETYWMCGARARAAVSDRTHRWPSAALAASGYFVSRTSRGDHLMLDVGPHGFMNGGHAHADALSCTLDVAGRPVLIDPGTATYTMDAGARDRFRSTAMHNTLMLNGRSQSEPRGPFDWSSTTDSQVPIWRTAAGCDYVEGTHAAYGPYRHTRALLAIHGVGYWVMDYVLGSGTAEIELRWHLHPRWTGRLRRPQAADLNDGSEGLALASTVALTILAEGSDPLAFWSPAYGVIEPAPVVVARTTARLPTTIGTFIPATAELANQLCIEEAATDGVAGTGWHTCAFRARWAGGVMTMLGAMEESGIASCDTAAPTRKWGTAEFQTDARAAVLISRHGGAGEVVLVNGASVCTPRHEHSLALAARVPLFRLAEADSLGTCSTRRRGLGRDEREEIEAEP
jgi:hypothetical protein